MEKQLTQFLSAVIGPLLTLGCTAGVVRYFSIRGESGNAIGAALAAAVLFGMSHAIETLPKKSRAWRKRFDKRAAFEGMWLQIHDDEPSRVAVFSFLYDKDDDAYKARGDAFDSLHEHLAHWESTQVFFTSDMEEVSYLWKGTTYENKKTEDREGTTTMTVDRAERSAEPVSGSGKVLHLMEARALNFRLKRVTQQYIKGIGKGFETGDLHDYERRKELAAAYFTKKGG